MSYSLLPSPPANRNAPPAPDAGRIRRGALTSDALAELQIAAQRLFGSGVAVAVTNPSLRGGMLMPAEEPAVARAAPSRRREFAAGRAAARRAIADLDQPNCAIPKGPGGAPVWPPGITGSISHCDTACIAVASQARRFASLGVDVEVAAPLDPVLTDIICSESELVRIARLPARRQALMATMIFSAKEAAYKCQFPLTGHLFDFNGFEIGLDLRQRRFTATFATGNQVFPKGYSIEGRYAITEGLIVTAARLRQSDLPATARETRQ